MRVFVTGGAGVLGTNLGPLLGAAGTRVVAPRPEELDLFDATAVAEALVGVDAVYHLATHIPPPDLRGEAGAWVENDRLRADASRVLVDAAIEKAVGTFVLPSVTFLYPPGAVADEDAPVKPAPHLIAMVEAERQCRRFAAARRRGVVLRLGLLWGPGTGAETPDERYGATLHVRDAARALVAALDVPSGIYNVVADGGRVANDRFKAAAGWKQLH